MAKERKTKRQKLLSDKRHFEKPAPSTQGYLYHLDQTPSLSSQTQKAVSRTEVLSASDYEYLLNDIKKIGIITGIIVLLELGIYWTSVGF